MAGGASDPDEEESGDEASRDRIIEQREFERAGGLDLSSFLTDETVEETRRTDSEDDSARAEVISKAVSGAGSQDIAVGDIVDPFSSPDEDESSRPGGVLRDGTVAVAPEQDSVSQMAVEGERRLHWGLMVSMIVTYSVIGALVGTALPPVIGAIGLILLAALGLWLGERWIPDPSMRILGVTWVIISMKLLYGLAIDLHHWGWLEGTAFSADMALGVILVLLVVLNILIAHHHDEDAIAAQATLVLLVMGSAAGALFGAVGVAIMIGIATILLHSLALLRSSGNLASLGIAATNLWIGVHALSDGWSIFGLRILDFEDPLLLFLLMVLVNGVNATMAARFCRSSNWFSDGFAALGLGRPGLWGVSVGLGMIGAIMAIGAYRLETGYALAQIVLLLAAFGGSYLIVRGVEFSAIQRDLIIPLPIVLLGLVAFEVGLIDPPEWGIGGYGLFAVVSALITAWALLKHQEAVSDHVLWIGALSMVLLLTMLVPADDAAGGTTLLIGVGLVFFGLAALAILRSSPSLAGVSVLAPWGWVLVFATDLEMRLVSQDLIPIILDPWVLSLFMISMGLVQIPVNLRLGWTGVNLAGRLLGASEISTRLRDSGIMRLWNMGFLAALIGWIGVARAGALPAEGLVIGLGSIWLAHSFTEMAGRHQGNPRYLLVGFGVAALIAQWRFGLDAVWPVLIVAGSSGLVRTEFDRAAAWAKDDQSGLKGTQIGTKPSPEKMMSLQMMLVAASLLLVSLGRDTTALDVEWWWPDESFSMWIMIVAVILALETYLPRAQRFEALLQPAFASLLMLISLLMASNRPGLGSEAFLISGVLFVISGAWLAAQGELRSGLKSVARRTERIEQHMVSKEAAIELNLDSPEGVRMFDPRVVELREKQAKRRRRSGSTGEVDLLVGDIHHRPVIVLTFLSGLILACTWWAFSLGLGMAMLALATTVSIIFIGLSRWRAGTLGLRLPDFLGMEIPIAISMLGLSLVYLGGRLSTTYIDPSDQGMLLILTIGSLTLAGFGLMGRDDLAIRIPSALEWILYVLVLTRLGELLLKGLMPAPLTVDPLDGGLLEWQLPWLVQEVVLLAVILVWDWVESKRLGHHLSDHRGAGGRSAIMMMVVIVSTGPAALLAVILGLRRSVDWDQPWVGMVALPCLLISSIALQAWVIPADIHVWVAGTLAVLILPLVTISVKMIKPPWTSAWLWDGQVLLPTAAILIFPEQVEALVISILIVSGLAWVSGVLQKRRGWRTIGALNLLAAWMAAAMSIQQGTIDVMAALAMLVATAILLGLVTWLGQSYEAELAAD